MTRHIIRAEVEVGEAVVKLDIEFAYHPGTLARGPSYSCGGEPGEGPEVELIHATLVDAAVFNPPRVVIDELAEDWLASDYGYEAACDLAVDEGGPDPDAAYERMRDDRWQP